LGPEAHCHQRVPLEWLGLHHLHLLRHPPGHPFHTVTHHVPDGYLTFSLIFFSKKVTPSEIQT